MTPDRVTVRDHDDLAGVAVLTHRQREAILRCLANDAVDDVLWVEDWIAADLPFDAVPPTDQVIAGTVERATAKAWHVEGVQIWVFGDGSIWLDSWVQVNASRFPDPDVRTDGGREVDGSTGVSYRYQHLDIHLCEECGEEFELADEIVCLSDGMAHFEMAYDVENRRFFHRPCWLNSEYMNTDSDRDPDDDRRTDGGRDEGGAEWPGLLMCVPCQQYVEADKFSGAVACEHSWDEACDISEFTGEEWALFRHDIYIRELERDEPRTPRVKCELASLMWDLMEAEVLPDDYDERSGLDNLVFMEGVETPAESKVDDDRRTDGGWDDR